MENTKNYTQALTNEDFNKLAHMQKSDERKTSAWIHK